MGFRDFAANRSFSGNGLWQWDEKLRLSGPAETKIWLDRLLVATMKRFTVLGYIKKPFDTKESIAMRGDEIRIPAWSRSFMDQNRFFIDLGLHLVLLALAISPFVILYIKRKSPAGWLDLLLLLGAMIGLPYSSYYGASILPEYHRVFIRGYGSLCMVVLVISIVMIVWKFKKLRGGAYAFRVIGTLVLLGLLIMLLLPAVPSAGEASRRMYCLSHLRQLAFALTNADQKVLDLREPAALNDPVIQGGQEVSWRVKLLPYIELDHLYQQYEFKSPWDSQANWAIACRRLELFTCPSEPDMTNPDGGRFTSYVMLENTNKNQGNPNLVYDQDRKLLDANRILLIESCGANVVWTEPRDADVDTLRWSLKPANRKEEKEPWRSTNVGASSHAGVVQVVFGDGSTRCLSKSIDEGVLRKVILGQASAEELD
jgi:hypothetical protein